MNKLLLVILVIGAAVGLFWFRTQQRAQLARIQAAEATLTETSARAEHAERRTKALRQEVIELQAANLSHAAEKTTASSKPPGSARTEHPATKLFRDPEMRLLMKKDFNAAMERNAAKVVNSNLVAQLGLNPDQTAQLKELVRRKQTGHTELLMAMMSGTASDAELAQVARAAREQTDAANAEIRTLLGEDGFAAYKWQEESSHERSQLSEFRAKFAEAGLPVSPEQEEALLQAMYDERTRFPFSHDFHHPENLDPNQLVEIYSEENLNRWIDEMQLLNDRIIAR
ncbi:MAG: hypothetical protein L0Y58_22035, partial [Verrucomicrobia subdivision 3 bacterium]|nr:hypothetical protein [Limisphaerales bacterium]